MKFFCGFLLALSIIAVSVGVAVADCSCDQLTPTSLGGSWGKTPSSASIVPSDSITFYMNPNSREAALRVYDGNPNIPVFHSDWYEGDPKYFSESNWREYCEKNGVGY